MLTYLLSFKIDSILQIGAGASSNDPRMPHEEGVEYLLNSYRRPLKGCIHLYEPNPANHASLARAWEHSVSRYRIFKEGVIAEPTQSFLRFYYHPKDEPHFQGCSIYPQHILDHHPTSDLSELLSFSAPCTPIEQALLRFGEVPNRSVFLAIDAEGLDYQLSTTLFRSEQVEKVAGLSIEVNNMDAETYSDLNRIAYSQGFINVGLGLDLHYWDRLYLHRSLSRFIRLAKLQSQILASDLSRLFNV